MKKTGQTEIEYAVRHIVGELALFGLLSEIVNPSCPLKKLEAERVLFADPPSTEKKQLCELMGMTQEALNANITAALQGAGYNQQINNYH